MRTVLVLTSLLLAAPAPAQQSAPALGNVLDIGIGYGDTGTLEWPGPNGTAMETVSARFVAHYALPLRRAAIGITSYTNRTNPSSTFTLEVCSDDGQGHPNCAVPLFTSSFTGAQIPASPSRVLLAVLGTSTGPLTAGATFHVVVSKLSGGDTFAVLDAPVPSAIDPITGQIESAPRNVLTGSSTRSGASSNLTTVWTEANREPIFAVEYDPTGCTTESCRPVDGTTYLGASSESLGAFTYAAEFFQPASLLPAPRQPIFALQIPATAAVSPAPHLAMRCAGGTLFDVEGVDTGVSYRGSPHWYLALFTSADAGAVTLDADGGWTAALIYPPSGSLSVPVYASGSSDVATLNNRGQYLGGANAAYVETNPNGAITPHNDEAMPFQLCGSEILGNGVDEDCSGADETAPTEVYTACHDHDGDGYGNPDDALTLSYARWSLGDGGTFSDGGPVPAPPPGYVADCSDCNDNDPSVHRCDGGSGSSSSASGSTSASGSAASSASSSGSGSSSAASSGSGSGSTSSSAASSGSGSGSGSTSSGLTSSSGTSSASASSSTSSSASSTGSTSGSGSGSTASGSSGSAGSTGSGTTGTHGSTGASAASAGASTGGAGSSGRPGPATPASFNLGGGCGCESVADPGFAFLAVALLWRRRPRILRA